MTLVVAAAAMIRVDIAPALERSVTLKQRTRARERPLTDDEITLLRVLATIKATKMSSSQPARLADAGRVLAHAPERTHECLDLVHHCAPLFDDDLRQVEHAHSTV